MLKTAFTEFTFQHKHNESSAGGLTIAGGYSHPASRKFQMGQKVKPKSIKVTVRLKDSPSESFTAICEPSLIDGWLHVETANTSVRIPESQIIRYSMADITDSPLLSSEPSNGQYSGITPEMAGYKASRLTEAAAETGQTLQLFKHLSVLLPIIRSVERNG